MEKRRRRTAKSRQPACRARIWNDRQDIAIAVYGGDDPGEGQALKANLARFGGRVLADRRSGLTLPDPILCHHEMRNHMQQRTVLY
jgi:hypothetical protein